MDAEIFVTELPTKIKLGRRILLIGIYFWPILFLGMFIYDSASKMNSLDAGIGIDRMYWPHTMLALIALPFSIYSFKRSNQLALEKKFDIATLWVRVPFYLLLVVVIFSALENF